MSQGEQQSAVAKVNAAAALEGVLIGGDLAKLTADQRVAYYRSLCESVGLNPLSQPFSYLVLSGKTVLYAKKDCTDQLRKIHGVSVQIVARERIDGDVFAVTARATDRTGRTDESIGAVPLGGLKGEALSNALMKAETKAKRRVTLSVCGLGMLDETEVDSIPGARPWSPPEEAKGPPQRDAAAAAKASANGTLRKAVADLAAATHQDVAALLDHFGAAAVADLTDAQCQEALALMRVRQRADAAAK